MVKLKICYKIGCDDYFHNGHSSYIKSTYVYNVVVLIINYSELATNFIYYVYVLCYLYGACHLCFCDAQMGFLVGVMGVGCCLCLHHLKESLVLSWMEDSFIKPHVDGIIGVWRRENLVLWWGTLRLLFLWAPRLMDWTIMESWTITSSIHVCLLKMGWGWGHTPYCHLWLSIHWLTFG